MVRIRCSTNCAPYGAGRSRNCDTKGPTRSPTANPRKSVSLVTAQHDRVVASYTLLSSVGRLSPQVLGLRVPVYDPIIHYQQVRDAWTGVRTPDGK